jgi:Putative peptidoglycan binding domain
MLPRTFCTVGILVLVGMVAVPAMRVWALDDAAARETLKGLLGVTVWVWDMTPETERGGVTKQQVQTEVEQQLRRAGITVSASEDASTPSGMTLLTVSVTTLRHTENLYAYTVDLAVYQTAVLLRDPTPRSLVTWSVGSIALVESSDLRAIFTSVGQQIEKFIQAYRSVNPRARPEGGQHAAARARLRQVQKRLQAAGFAPGPLDGRLGPQTRAALRRYQQRQGLRVTGSPDPQTLKALRLR